MRLIFELAEHDYPLIVSLSTILWFYIYTFWSNLALGINTYTQTVVRRPAVAYNLYNPYENNIYE